MTISVSSTFSSQPPYASSSAADFAGTPQAQPPLPSDDVTLSPPAQVSQLSKQGQAPLQIAEALGIGVLLVNVDLGILATTAPAPAAMAAEPAHAETSKPPAPTASA